MLRSLLPRATLKTGLRSSVAPRRVLLAVKHARFESTTPTPEAAAAETPAEQAEADRPARTPADKKAWLKAQDDLQRDWDAKELTYEELKPKTEQPTPDRYIIDVREPDEVLQGSIPSAVNLPLSVLTNSLNLHSEAFKKRFGWEKPKKHQEIVFYCRSGKRSTSACDIAKRNGYKNILNYKGSWLDWISKEGQKSS